MRDDVDIRTERLLLRRWRDADLESFAALNADPRVMRYFPAPLTREESDAMVARIRAHFDEHGFGLWAVERRAEADFIGFVGLNTVPFAAPFTPAVEIGWRLAAHAWGRGYATEAARAVVAHAFGALDLAELVSFTVPANERSRGVMQRIGMTHDPADDFDHPKLPVGHPLRRHVLYRLASTRGGHVHDPRHRFSYELRPDDALERSIRELAIRLEQLGLLAPGASTAPRFQPHLTLARASLADPTAVAAIADAVTACGTPLTLARVGTFGEGRIIWLAPEPEATALRARAALVDVLDPATLDPLVHARPWTPHVTVAYAVDEPVRARALQVVAAQLPLRGAWASVQAWDLDVRPTRLVAERPLRVTTP